MNHERITITQTSQGKSRGKKREKTLQVPQHHMEKADKAMRNKSVSGTVKNMSGTKRRSVK